MYTDTYTRVFTTRANDIRGTKGNGPTIREGFEKYANAYRANCYRKSTDWAFAESLLMGKKHRQPSVDWTITGEISFGLFHLRGECKFRVNPTVTGSFVRETPDENKRITGRMKIFAASPVRIYYIECAASLCEWKLELHAGLIKLWLIQESLVSLVFVLFLNKYKLYEFNS